MVVRVPALPCQPISIVKKREINQFFVIKKNYSKQPLDGTADVACLCQAAGESWPAVVGWGSAWPGSGYNAPGQPWPITGCHGQLFQKWF